MKNRNLWVNLSLFNLCTVAILGVTLRSKMLFEMPFIDYNHLADAHGHFAFGGWITLALLSLFCYELLLTGAGDKKSYQWILAGIVITSWVSMFTQAFQGNSMLTNVFSTFFILTTYVFSFCFIKDLRKATINKSVRLLAISATCCLVLSSSGPFMLAYLFSIKSLNAILYRDALFTYLHLQYNGFFTLAVFALLFHKIIPKASIASRKHISVFSILLTLSIIPSLFLSFLWHDPHPLFWIMATIGGLLVFLSFVWFMITGLSLKNILSGVPPIVKYLGILSMSAFGIKEFLQGFTLFPSIGDAVFGSRPTIIGFLHLVFLGLTSLFILGWYVQKGYLNPKLKFTSLALVFFTVGIILNEGVLMLQGLGAMFIISYSIFPLLLWYISIWLLSGTFMIGVARMLGKQS